MTTFDRFDPFERRIGDALEVIEPMQSLAYLDDVFRQTARSRQRPRWSFLERWLPMDTALARPMLLGRRVPYRSILVLAVLAALLAATAVYVGTQKQLPAPFGLAANGQIAYAADGDIYVRDSLTGQGRVLIRVDGTQFGPTFSPDGTHIAYFTGTSNGDDWYAANADGSSPVLLAHVPPTGNAQAAWAPDSRHVAAIFDREDGPRLSVIPIDGSGEKIFDLGALTPLNVAWAPPDGSRLLVQAHDAAGTYDLYSIGADGTGLRALGLQATSMWGDNTNSGPVFSPDGRKIAYNVIETTHGLNGRTHFRIGLVNADGSDARILPGPENADTQEGWPLFSPDGKWIVVHEWDWQFANPAAEGWLAIIPADGSAPARDIGFRYKGGEQSGIQKVWSPDGTRIIVSAANSPDVYSVDPVTGAYELLPWAPALPDWQRVAR